MSAPAAGSRSRHHWERLGDKALLRLRFRDLGLRVAASSVQADTLKVCHELERRGIRFRPHFWFSTDWFSPDGVPGIAVPFFLVRDRGGTEFRFIVEGIDQTAMWVYASVYMTCVAAITATTIARGVLTTPGALVVFRIGLTLVLVASVDEVVSLTADHFRLFDPAVRDVLRFAFDPPFYLGIVLLVTAMGSLTLRRWARNARSRPHLRRLSRIARRHGVRAVDRGGDVQVRTYDLVIALRDAEVQGRALDEAEQAQVRSAERTLTKDMG